MENSIQTDIDQFRATIDPSSSCERSFSSLRRLKTWSRTSMANVRLNGLALAYIRKPTEIDSSSVLKRWYASGHRRIALTFRSKD